MNVRRFLLCSTMPIVCTVSLLAGCGRSEPSPPARPGSSAADSAKAPHDPNDVPITEADVKKPSDFSDAVARIKSYRGTIRDEIAAGRPNKAHRSLDELDIVLNWLPGIARDSGIPKAKWEELNTTAQEIRDLFNKVHSNIDAKKDPDYASVSAEIDKAIGRLDSVGPASKQANE